MSQYPFPSSIAPLEPYYGKQLTEDESTWGSSSNPALPALRPGAASDVFMGASTSHNYEDEDQDFFEAMQYNTSGIAHDEYSFAENLEASWPSHVAQDPLQLPTNDISDQTLGRFDMSTAMSDPNYFSSIAASTNRVTQAVEVPTSLPPTELSNCLLIDPLSETSINALAVDSSYQGPAVATKASSHPRAAGSDDDDNDADDSSSDLRINMADKVPGRGGFQHAFLRDATEKSQGNVPDDSSLEATQRIPSSSLIEARVIAKPRKSRGKKQLNKSSTATEQVPPVFPEPDATYDFAVTDKDDVFLDPKPEAEFGTHESHLVKKVSDATRDLKVQNKPVSQTLPTLGQQRVLWHPPADDHSIPTTPAHYKICFDLLVRAIDYSGEDVVERRDSKEFQRRWIDREHYDPGFVQVLAKQVLDTMIDVHRNGWTYYVQDPAFRLMYHKTMYFTFRDRFNVTALVLKYSKTTCDGILKGQRLYDVIGNSYHLETRVTSNKKANSDRAIKLAKIKKEEEATGQKVAKRTHDANEEEEPSDQANSSKKPRKRAIVSGGTHLPAEAPYTVSSGLIAESATNTIAKVPRSRAVGRGSAKTSKKRSTKIAASKSPVLDDDSAEIALGNDTRNSGTS
ncbi:uncharacterized protein EKO05_0002604 [Ascochyta rabiei]|uniref:uncharacterized protein n=1 Tax=Didymella rabiei TaxID=5454 RepID=UPI0021FC410C|nr:uncharacterized protein EKO05_0002604 [Ascochyta rabiei]UPX12027.1 hypothetical protein EKO05_0002604 [Ascochyta rabiei]